MFVTVAGAITPALELRQALLIVERPLRPWRLAPPPLASFATIVVARSPIRTGLMCGTVVSHLALRPAMLDPRRVDSLGRPLSTALSTYGRERARDYPRAVSGWSLHKAGLHALERRAFTPR